jgi:uncharacterized repeat protein (TIGR04138 family)
MPPPAAKTLEQIVADLDRYPIDAFVFVQEGLEFAIKRIHGERNADGTPRHVTGQQLCEGLREFALNRWGRLSRTVLRRWGVTSTYDFGRIVFAMIAGKLFDKTENDEIDDFRDVYDFRSAFESDYRIPEALPANTAVEGRS